MLRLGLMYINSALNSAKSSEKPAYQDSYLRSAALMLDHFLNHNASIFLYLLKMCC